MAYCPKCRYEYEPKVMYCQDCHESLVDELKPGTSAAVRPDDSWVRVGGVFSGLKADLAKGSLDSSNIPSVVLSSTFGAYGRGMDFGMGLTNSGKESNVIMVPREYKEEAVLILESVLGDDFSQAST